MKIQDLNTPWDDEMRNFLRAWAHLLACQGRDCCGGLLMIQPITIRRLLDFEKYIQRKLFPTNAYRCKIHNRAIGGLWNSLHCYGLAIDIRTPDNIDIEGYVEAAHRFFGGVKIYPKKKITHLQVLPPRG